MRVKTIVDEDFINYKVPVMFVGSISCGGKCCTEAGIPLSVCQNDGWRACAPILLDDDDIIQRYLTNDITQAIVFGGLEPFEQFNELLNFIRVFRDEYSRDDDIVIYTGYKKEELRKEIKLLKHFKNIVIKFGRYIPGDEMHFDEVLGVMLASQNQFGERIS